MTADEIRNGLQRLRCARYSTGVLHIAEPAWVQDIRWCLEALTWQAARLAALEAGLREVLDGFPTRDAYPGVMYPGAWTLTGRLPLARVNALRALLTPEAKEAR